MKNLGAFLSNNKIKLIAFATLAGIMVIMSITVRARRLSVANSKEPNSNASMPDSLRSIHPTTPSSSRPELERVTVTSSGFDPLEITRPAGQIVLAIDNRSGLDEVWLRLDREGGDRLIDVHVEREKLDWRGHVTLAPGRYRLTEASHSDWLCLITVSE